MRTTTKKLALPRAEQEWRALVDEWRSSRQSTREFCEDRGLTVKTFQWRRWLLGKQRKSGERGRRRRVSTSGSILTCLEVREKQAPAPAFIEISLPTQGRQGSGVEIAVAGVRGEHRVRVEVGFDAMTLRQVVAVLEEA